MARIGAKLRNYYKGDGIVSNTVGNRVYGVQAPQNSDRPYLRLIRVSERSLYTHSGKNDWRETSVQHDCVAKTASQAEQLVEDIINSSSRIVDEKGMQAAQINTILDQFPDEDRDGAIMRVDISYQYTTQITTT